MADPRNITVCASVVNRVKQFVEGLSSGRVSIRFNADIEVSAIRTPGPAIGSAGLKAFRVGSDFGVGSRVTKSVSRTTHSM